MSTQTKAIARQRVENQTETCHKVSAGLLAASGVCGVSEGISSIRATAPSAAACGGNTLRGKTDSNEVLSGIICAERQLRRDALIFSLQTARVRRYRRNRWSAAPVAAKAS